MAIVILESEILEAQVVNDAFVPLAIEAGIETVIKSLLVLATTKRELLILVKAALAVSNPPLAKALGMQTLEAILKYMQKRAAGIVMGEAIPELLDEDGPASVTVARDGTVNTQINVTFTKPANGYTPRIYLDGVFQKNSTVTPSGQFMNDSLANVPAGAHSIRVLFRRDTDGAQTRFGPIGAIAE
ncbi:MAG: hypothetical protein K8L91_07980 [Anaerolineae bacterium]|nr:hypothetical protein [Anaerolineae bacterium]